ncbi:MAG: helix-turn-helix domain-containing protein, partial [Caulobacteraceae bacterium]
VAVFQRIAYPANATAQSDCRVITWPAADAPALLAADPAIALNAVRMLGGRTLDMLLRLHEVSAIGVEPRVARAILREVEEQAVGGRSQRNEVRLSRRALAELSATTLHTVSRLVSGWSRDGIVIAGRGRLVIRDAPALAARALRGTGEV